MQRSRGGEPRSAAFAAGTGPRTGPTRGPEPAQRSTHEPDPLLETAIPAQRSTRGPDNPRPSPNNPQTTAHEPAQLSTREPATRSQQAANPRRSAPQRGAFAADRDKLSTRAEP